MRWSTSEEQELLVVRLSGDEVQEGTEFQYLWLTFSQSEEIEEEVNLKMSEFVKMKGGLSIVSKAWNKEGIIASVEVNKILSHGY